MREIGSEFWNIEKNDSEVRFFVYGRAALEHIIRDILATKKIKNVYMPSYCCSTMIEPFVRHNLSVNFYDVYFFNGSLCVELPEVCSKDILFYIEYFGYKNASNIFEIEKNGATIIEDCSHSWLLNDGIELEPKADYIFSSYRKWTGFTGIASAKKNNGQFIINEPNKYSPEFEKLKSTAQMEKEVYIKKNIGDKESFLNVFSEADRLIKNDYVDLKPSFESIVGLINIDNKKIKNSRRNNAKILLENLESISEIVPIFSSIKEYDVPLFVPVFMEENLRNKLRHFLISKNIYCPIHWPLSDFHKGISEKAELIYKSEMSLICDQRYNDEDMNYFIQCIYEFFEMNKKNCLGV